MTSEPESGVDLSFDASGPAPAEDEAPEVEVPVTGVEADGPAPESAPLDVEALIEQLESVTSERDRVQDQLLRSVADFDNLRKRAQRDQAEAAKSAIGRFVDTLLPVLDACDAAQASGVDGVEPIVKALLGALEQQGLTAVGQVGEPFDPTWHEAVLVEPAAEGHEADTVTDVLRTGYRWEDRVLRAAMVKVAG
ncbi:MAG: nucleotide exchange factor GrpE [Actinomycetota bacterium]